MALERAKGRGASLTRDPGVAFGLPLSPCDGRPFFSCYAPKRCPPLNSTIAIETAGVSSALSEAVSTLLGSCTGFKSLKGSTHTGHTDTCADTGYIDTPSWRGPVILRGRRFNWFSYPLVTDHMES